MNSKVQIAAISMDIIWKDPEKNFQLIEKEVTSISADIIVLPEMFSTGFCMQPEEIVDKENVTLAWMKKMAKLTNSAFTGSVAVEEQGCYFNRMYFVHPEGISFHYDKKHLFSYAGEDQVYMPGSERIIVEYKGVRILLQICYDLRFPVFSRNNNDYDVALYIANWPKVRISAWEALLKARAIENQAYILGVNRIGRDGNGLEYPLSTYGFFADGTLISHPNNGSIFTIDIEELDAYRRKYRFLEDRDRFTLD